MQPSARSIAAGRVHRPAVVADHAQAEHHLANRLAAGHGERGDVAKRQRGEECRRTAPAAARADPRSCSAGRVTRSVRYNTAASIAASSSSVDQPGADADAERRHLHQRRDGVAARLRRVAGPRLTVRDQATRRDRAASSAADCAAPRASSGAPPEAAARRAAARSARHRTAARLRRCGDCSASGGRVIAAVAIAGIARPDRRSARRSLGASSIEQPIGGSIARDGWRSRGADAAARIAEQAIEIERGGAQRSLCRAIGGSSKSLGDSSCVRRRAASAPVRRKRRERKIVPTVPATIGGLEPEIAALRTLHSRGGDAERRWTMPTTPRRRPRPAVLVGCRHAALCIRSQRVTDRHAIERAQRVAQLAARKQRARRAT